MRKNKEGVKILNNSGFAVAGVVYSILLLFVLLLTSLLIMLGNRKRILDGLNDEILRKVNASSGLEIQFQYGDILLTNTSLRSDNTFDLLDDVSLYYKGEEVDNSSISYTSSPSFDSTKNGKYVITYTASYQGLDVVKERNVSVVDPRFFSYEFVGASQTFVPKTSGLYSVELWGAEGYTEGGATAGKGAYTRGTIDLKQDEPLYVYVGQGLNSTIDSLSFNGGTGNGGTPGGGATDVRLVSGSWDNFNSLKSRIMVAAGSGSASGAIGKAGSGGTLTGMDGSGNSGGTQTHVGASDTTFPPSRFGVANGECAGGNGYYPGGSTICRYGSSGGSSFISGYTGCDAISGTSTASSIVHTGQPNHYSLKVFTNSVMIDGDTSMPTHDGTGTMIGNSGHGYAKITPLVISQPITFRAPNVIVANQSKVSHFTFDPFYGVEIIGEDGQKVSGNTITYTSSPTFDGRKNGIYTFTYETTYNGLPITASRVVRVVDAEPFGFSYTGDMQTFTADKSGLYSIELWGAQGAFGAGTAGKGAYTKGEIDLVKNETLYVYVGEGLKAEANATSFNGGVATNNGWPGGGATDVRLSAGAWNDFASLKTRIMVAAGSGSCTGDGAVCGSGGALTGIAGGGTEGGSQTAPSNPASGLASSTFGVATGGCTGGGGYYPGGGADCASGAGGGSSYISGHTGCNSITATSAIASAITHTGMPNHYSSKVFTHTVMANGNASMPNYDATRDIAGNTGHGYAKITPLVTLFS